MFTGLIDDVGTITAVREGEAGREFRVACRYEDLALGESIACQGACLTVREAGDGWFGVAAVVTTLDRTTVATWNVGRRLNLERAMRLGDRLGGHLVQGHVDDAIAGGADDHQLGAQAGRGGFDAAADPLRLGEGEFAAAGADAQNGAHVSSGSSRSNSVRTAST